METTMLDCLDRLTDWDARMRRRLVYLYAMSKDHPTARGRKLAAIEYARTTEYMNDVWSGWKDVKMALWPKEESK